MRRSELNVLQNEQNRIDILKKRGKFRKLRESKKGSYLLILEAPRAPPLSPVVPRRAAFECKVEKLV